MEQKQEPWGGTVSVNLNKLNNVEVVQYRGKKCITIPADENGIYISDKGTIVLSFFMSKLPMEKWGKTHELKRKLSGDEYKAMSKDDRAKQPVVGYFEPLKPKENKKPQQQTKKTNTSDVEDLPW